MMMIIQRGPDAVEAERSPQFAILSIAATLPHAFFIPPTGAITKPHRRKIAT